MTAGARPTPAVIRLERTGSTMDALHELAQAGAPAGTAVVAAEQAAGRGSRGRGWRSPRGGLWLSVLARPAAGIELVSLRAGLAVAERLARPDLGIELGLKWPNDLMLGERKAGGVLCEARWQGAAAAWVAVGVGINVTNPAPPELGHAATRLAEVRPELTPERLVGPVVDALRGLESSADRLTAGELARFARRDWLRGRRLAGPVAGEGDGVTPDGALLVRTPDGRTRAVRTGTVALAAPLPEER